ncbi:uncharacterized protein LOC119672945 [Teleopsis dalmanni]|uniref:uncharacterized protein LOC119672945 n=1 Tax=Teleopsis dalmanni TaxID=139649 RepID=UPI0018CEB9A5|nr:uncharacterized protein LOC119672945 [Teleopsis dalmanni]
MFNKLCLFVVLLILAVKVCTVNGGKLTNKTEAYAMASGQKKQDTSSVESYFKRDPYGPNTYAFGFEINDKKTGNVQFRDERRFVNGSTEGAFGYLRPDGRVTISRFIADKKRGYLTHTETFSEGDKYKWQKYWPTEKPDIIMDRPIDMSQTNITFNKALQLNETYSKLPINITNEIQKQHGLDVNSVDFNNDILDPLVDEIINGKIPLKKVTNGKSANGIGFETVHNFIPTDFHIAPFQLPADDEQVDVGVINKQERKYVNDVNEEMGSKKQMQYAAAKENTSVKNLAKDISLDVKDKKSADRNGKSYKEKVERPDNFKLESWYKQIIDEARKEFLQNY